MKKFNIYLYFVLILIFVLGIYETDGAIWGWRRGGSSLRTRSGSRAETRRIRVGSVTRFSTRSSYRGPYYKPGTWKTTAGVGTLFGLNDYEQRRRYIGSPDREPVVCFNEKNLRNGTYGYFICPEEGQDDDMAYCCGDEDEQRCCKYADESAVGRIAGIIIGVIAGSVVVGVLVYSVSYRIRRWRNSNAATYVSRPSSATTSVHYRQNQLYFSNASNFQYNEQKQDLSMYPETTNTRSDDTIGNSEGSGSTPFSSGPIGLEGSSSQQPNGEPLHPEFSATPCNGFQYIPSAQPPSYYSLYNN